MAHFIKNKVIMGLSNLRLLAITVFILGSFVFMNPAFAGGGYPAYQCIERTSTEALYCSTNKVKSHAEGSKWIKTCNFSGKVTLKQKRPENALTCPPV